MTTPSLIPRVPHPHSPTEEMRLRRALDLVAERFNSLTQRGLVEQVSEGTWGLLGIWFQGNGSPAASLGDAGDFYLDVAGRAIWYKS